MPWWSYVYAGTVRFRKPRKPTSFGEMKAEVAPHSMGALTVRTDPDIHFVCGV